METSNKLKLFTLFSGYESQMMALEAAASNCQVSAELVGWSEIDKIVQSIHNAAYPEYAERVYPDVTQIDWDTVGDIDILFASSPCQDVSRAGIRKGMQKDSSTRSSLVWEVEKAIAIKRPKWFIEENVMGMLDYIDDFENLVRSISSYGYVCFFRGLKGCDYGIPHNRPRLFLVAIRIDEDEPYPVFQWPESIGTTLTPEDLLSDCVDDKYYLSEEEIEAYVDLVRNACDGYTSTLTTNDNSPTRFYNRQFTRRVNRIVAPLCKNGAIPTLTMGIQGVSLVSMAGCRQENHPCVIELWEGRPDIKPEITDEKALNRKIKAKKECQESKRILNFIDSVKEGQYVRIRRLTPEECLRFLGVPDKQLQRIMQPYEQLLKEGYTEQQIYEMLPTIKSRSKFHNKFSDYALYGRAGNSIIVDVMEAIFSEIIEQEYIGSNKGREEVTRKIVKEGDKESVKERRRRTSRAYYERHKEDIRRKSREYHRERRRQLKQVKELAGEYNSMSCPKAPA